MAGFRGLLVLLKRMLLAEQTEIVLEIISMIIRQIFIHIRIVFKGSIFNWLLGNRRTNNTNWQLLRCQSILRTTRLINEGLNIICLVAKLSNFISRIQVVLGNQLIYRHAEVIALRFHAILICVIICLHRDLLSKFHATGCRLLA